MLPKSLRRITMMIIKIIKITTETISSNVNLWDLHKQLQEMMANCIKMPSVTAVRRWDIMQIILGVSNANTNSNSNNNNDNANQNSNNNGDDNNTNDNNNDNSNQTQTRSRVNSVNIRGWNCFQGKENRLQGLAAATLDEKLKT